MNHDKMNVSKLFWGLCFLLGAAALILNRLGYLTLVTNISGFSILLTIFFTWMFFHGLHRRNFFVLMFSIAFLVILYDEPLKITAITPWTVLIAAFMGAIGLSILFPARFRSNSFSYRHENPNSKVFNEADDEIIHFDNSFGSSIKYINTDSFVKGSFETSFGEMKVYFDNATIKNGSADINIEVSFGNMVLYIPRTWQVECYVHCSFGDIKEQNKNVSQGSPVLRIYGDVSFGGAEIIYI